MNSIRKNPAIICSLLILFLAVVICQRPPMIRPIFYRMPSPPVLTGPLATNRVLTFAEKVHQNRIYGPTSFVNHDGHLYAVTIDSKLYDLARCPPRLIANLAPPGCYSKDTCGQLTSLRRDPATNKLLVLDTYRGLFSVDPTNGNFQLLYSANIPVNGRRPVHLNDMVVSPDGVVMMTDSSDVYNIDNDVYICMDGRPTSRLLAFHPKNGFATELLPGVFNFANGLELTPDGDLLITETCRAAIHRVSLKRSSWLYVRPFTVNLPGLPDNIRSSGRGTYWVAMTYARHSGISNPIDETAGNPRYRRMGFNMMGKQQIRGMFSKWGMIVELDANGNIINSLQDPTGATLSVITEVNEFGGVLNIGSYAVNYMTRVLLPPETGVKTSVDSFIQVKRSRCQLPDSQVEATRRQLLGIPEASISNTTITTIATTPAIPTTKATSNVILTSTVLPSTKTKPTSTVKV